MGLGKKIGSLFGSPRHPYEKDPKRDPNLENYPYGFGVNTMAGVCVGVELLRVFACSFVVLLLRLP